MRHDAVSAHAPSGVLRRLGRSGARCSALCGAGARRAALSGSSGGVPAEEVQLNRDADGIVALTGGASRIADAIELLGGRPRQAAADQRHQSCDQSAVRSRGSIRNSAAGCAAASTSIVRSTPWATPSRSDAGRATRFPFADRRHLLLSHAARAGRDRAPAARDDAAAIPGRDGQLRGEPWWANSATARLMLSEYVKLIFAKFAWDRLNPADRGERCLERAGP